MTGSSSPQHALGSGPAAADNRTTGTDTGASGGDARPAAKGKEPSSTGSRLALRNWRISTRLVSLLALPVVVATSLGVIRINDSMDEIEQLDRMKLLTEMTKQATELAAALQDERDKSAGPLSHGVAATDFTVKGPRDKTDRAQKSFVQGTAEIDDNRGDQAIDSIRANVVTISAQLQTLKDLRRNAYKKGTPTSQTVSGYNQLINQLLGLSRDMALATSNPEMIQRTRTLSAFSSAKENASIQRAVIAAALPENKETFGKLSESDRLYALSAWRNEDAELSNFERSYSGTGGNAEELLKPIDDSNAVIKDANSYAQRVLENSKGLKSQDKRSYPDWGDAASTKLKQMSLIEQTLLNDMEQEARKLREESEQAALFNGALLLLVLGVSLVGAFVVARSMIRSLRRLQDTATKVAQERLPELVKQLSETDPQDVDTSVESVGVHSRDEIGQVATAFDDVHREAVRLAAEQALLRGNVNAMFTNLSRRSQGLIQRQLSLISELESREADPDQLSSLFKLDHLATRMRRNGENLLVLAGEEPGRRWTRPVPLVDVLRAAASEVEQYERIELASVPTTEVAGRVVNDLVHLLAELLENATSFSSPQTKVRVTGHALPDGRVLVEIHDTGIGLSPEDLAAINERLAAPPTVDVSVSRRMGLFVVGRLSQRHGIRIQLRPSDAGGTTALVMLPVDVAQGGKKGGPGNPGAPGASGGPAVAQAAAGAAAARRGGGGPGGAPGGGGLLGGAPPRGQVAGAGPRAALPGRGDGGPGAGAPGQRSGLQQNGFQQGPPQQNGPQQNGPQGGPVPGDGFAARRSGSTGMGTGQGQGAPGDSGIPTRSDVFGGAGAGPAGGQQAPQGGHASPPQQRTTHNSGGRDDRQPQLPPRGGPRGELPGGNQQPRVPAWSDQSAQPPVGPDRPDRQDTPREHQEPDATAPFARPDVNGPRHEGLPQRPEFSRVRPNDQQGQPGQQGQSQRQQPEPPRGAGQRPRALPQRPEGPMGAGARNGARDTADFAIPQPPEPRPAQQQRPEEPRPRTEPWELPAAGPGDGRTPLYDTLETNWFRSQGGEQQQTPDHTDPTSPTPSAPEAAPAPEATAPANWRSSPNDELVRQAERVKKPSAGGITTSGLPRRVPRANLVAGTAEQQQQQSGPQVSRAPDDVRGRLTNLRRGIQQGREAGSGQTGSFPRPSHQQER